MCESGYLFPGKVNGMLRHSLATLEGEQEFLVCYRALLPLGCSPLSLFVAVFFSFFHFNRTLPDLL